MASRTYPRRHRYGASRRRRHPVIYPVPKHGTRAPDGAEGGLVTPRWQDLTPEDPGYENACLDYQVDLQSERARHPSVQRAVRTLRRRARGWLEMGPATDGFVLAAALTVLPAEDVSIASDLYIRLRQHMVDLPAHWSGTLAPILTALGELLELQHQTPGLPWRIGPLPAERPAA